METNSMQPENIHELDILSQIEKNPDISQASLAREVGVAVGTINWYLKRLIEKGCVKVKRAQRKKLKYIITPEGIALRTRLTLDYVQSSFQLYRLIRERSLKTLKQLENQGFREVRIIGEGDVADVCNLTCIEKGFNVVESADAPCITIDGLKLLVSFQGESL
jgi:predicted transcriptional regulator